MLPRFQRIVVLLSTVIICQFGCGCTHMIKPPAKPFTGYTPQEKIPLKVGLNLTPELRNAKWEKSSMGDTWVIPMGPSLCQNSEALARHVFTEVIIFDSSGNQRSAVDAVLTPRPAYVNNTMVPMGGGASIISVKVEWNLMDTAGHPIWVDTVGGEGKGGYFTRPEQSVKTALEELMLKSQTAITSAEAIRNFAKAKR